VWQPSERYPDPAIEILDPAFAPYVLFSAGLERIATGFRWCEGPVWFGDGRYLLWSDIPNNRIMKSANASRRRIWSGSPDRLANPRRASASKSGQRGTSTVIAKLQNSIAARDSCRSDQGNPHP
jgi:sugar lactone lactonase YvrE